jgi:hypothetical protein
MTVAALVLRADDDDADAAAGVVATGGIILATGGWYWLDPAVALIIAYHSLTLLRKASPRPDRRRRLSPVPRRRTRTNGGPVLLIIGSPMGAE